MKNLTLFHRFFLIISGVAITPLLIVSAYLFHYQKMAKENTLEFHQQLAGFSANLITDYMSSLNRRLAFMADLERALGSDQMEQFKVINQALVTNPDFAVLSVTDPGGKETVKAASSKFITEMNPIDRSRDPAWLDVSENGLAALGPVHDLAGIPVVNLVYPLKTGDFAFLTVNLSGLWKKLQAPKIGKTGKIVVADVKGNILAGFSGDEVPKVAPAFLAKMFGSDTEGSRESIPSDKGVQVGGFHSAETSSTKWYVLTLQPQDEAFLAASQMTVQVIVFILLISAAAFGVAWFVATKITEPLLDLTRWALRVSKNDFSTPVQEPGWGELNTLARTANQMMKALKSYSELQIDRIMEEKSKVETIVYTIPDGLVMANFNGELMYLNSPAMGVLGIDPKKAGTPKGVFDVIRQEKLKKAMTAALARNEKVEDVEVEVEEPGSSEKKYYKTKATIVKTPEQKDVGVLLIMHDVSFEKQMEKMKEGFFHSVAHDLRAPIFGVQGYLHLLEKRIKPGPVEQGYFKSMYASCDKLIALVKDILDVAQLESGSVKIDPSEIDVKEFVQKVHGAFVPVAIDRSLEMKIDIAPGEHGRMVCDERLTDRVLSNLISNALKFTPAPGSVTIHLLKTDAQNVYLQISDTGPGVPPSKIGSLFGKFVQIDGPQKSQGFGLGLSICKTVVELHGGKIWVESEGIPGKGCFFKIIQPRMCPAENCKSDPKAKVGTYGQGPAAPSGPTTNMTPATKPAAPAAAPAAPAAAPPSH